MFWALTLYTAMDFKCPLEVGPDNLTALNWTVDTWKSGCCPMAAALCTMAYEAAAKTAEITMKHTKGHDMCPWNELADSVCKAATNIAPSTLPPAVLEHIVGGEVGRWDWLIDSRNDAYAAYPRLRNGIFVFTPQASIAEVPGLRVAHDEAATQADLSFATLNVESQMDADVFVKDGGLITITTGQAIRR